MILIIKSISTSLALRLLLLTVTVKARHVEIPVLHPPSNNDPTRPYFHHHYQYQSPHHFPFFYGARNENENPSVYPHMNGFQMREQPYPPVPIQCRPAIEQPGKDQSLQLRDILPEDYKSYDKFKPPKVTNEPTVVYFHVTVLSIDSIDEESMTYVADIFLAQSWRDDRLRLGSGKMDDHYRILDVEWLKDIWRPDSFFKNAKSVTFHEVSVPNHYLWLYNDKSLLYISKLTLVLSCAMKFETFPHDTQVCSMMIESLSHTTDNLIFRWNQSHPLVINPGVELPQLDISRNATEDCTLEYSTGNFTCLAVVFELKRRLGYHLFHTYIPSGLIVVMSWISFWIKPEATPARITLGVTSLLTLATQNTQSQSFLPPVSYVKAIDIWMSSCTVFVFMSLMEFAVVNHYLGPKHPIDKGYEDILDLMEEHRSRQRKSSRASCQYYHLQGTTTVVSSLPTKGKFCNKNNVEIAYSIDRASRFLFPLAFIILNIIYWYTFLS